MHTNTSVNSRGKNARNCKMCTNTKVESHGSKTRNRDVHGHKSQLSWYECKESKNMYQHKSQISWYENKKSQMCTNTKVNTCGASTGNRKLYTHEPDSRGRITRNREMNANKIVSYLGMNTAGQLLTQSKQQYLRNIQEAISVAHKYMLCKNHLPHACPGIHGSEGVRTLLLQHDSVKSSLCS